MNGDQGSKVKSQPAPLPEMDLSNVVEFPLTSNSELTAALKTHLQNLFLSYGRERVLQYIMQTQGLQRVEQRGLFKKVA